MKSFYTVLCGSFDLLFPWKSIWKAHVPTKIAFFTLSAALGKIIMVDLTYAIQGLFLFIGLTEHEQEQTAVRVLNICCFIVKLLWSCGFSYSVFLGCNR